MTAQPIATSTPLSAAMRTGSQADHAAAEGSTFMEELLAGRINEAGYTAYLQRLRPVYAALEEVARSFDGDRFAAAVHDPALERLATIDADLDHWAPGAPHETDSAASAAYVERVKASAAWGGLFLAQHYTRYLGDLSGGQAIGRILDRAFDLNGQGVAFYDFSAIEKPKVYKDDYRDRLDGLALSEEEIERVVAEVRVAFGLNQAIFVELSSEIDTFRR